MNQFISPTAFDQTPATTIVVCCSDGRTRRQIAEFIDNMGIEADVYAIPGGPLAFAGGVETFLDGSVAEKRLKFLAHEHHSKNVILVVHGSNDDAMQCSMAKMLYGHCQGAERMEKVKTALHQAVKRIRSVTQLPVSLYIANVIGDVVQFQEITAP